ncbi:venom serine protease-like [Oratosquilla oratoria]|uniref:venom serine protease-like n=1 Tax=Oratosquilla oratoria TaxID=337810 RepID=UPI003F75D41D
MMSYHYLVILFLLKCVQSHSRHPMIFPDHERHLRSSDEGDYEERNCSSGEDCRLLQSCKSLFLLLEALNMSSVQILKKAQCGFMGNHPKVCCAIGDDQTPPVTTFPPHPSNEQGDNVNLVTIFPRPPLPTRAPFPGGNGQSGGGIAQPDSFPRPAPPIPFPSPMQPTSTARPTTTTLRTTTTTTTTELSKSKCGAVPPSRAIEGDVPQFGFYSWAVTLQFSVARAGVIRSQLQCGGALISGRHVLTAAHCLEKSTRHPRTLSEIVIGEHNLTSTPDCMLFQNGQTVCASKERHFTPESIVIHPNYDAKTRANDIAIIKLSADVPLTIDSIPACLPAPNQDITPFLRERRVQTSGWGLNTGNSKPYKVKHQISLKYEDPSVCSQYYNMPLSQGQLCFSSRSIGKYELKCTKDSGGSLFTNFDITGPPYTLVGIVSVAQRGRSCLSPNDMGPTVVTDVSYYLPWIREHVFV